MARKKIHGVKFGRCAVSIHRDAETSEYVVTTTIGGKKDGGYFTDDKADARGTAAVIIRRLRRDRACRS